MAVTPAAPCLPDARPPSLSPPDGPLLPERRQLLRCGLAGTVAILSGCGGGADAAGGPTSPLAAPSPDHTPSPDPTPPPDAVPSPAPTPSPAPQPTELPKWSPQIPVLRVGSADTFDLATTLPTGIEAGGVFGVDPDGTPLPPGMSLSRSGILAVGAANAGTVTAVVFTYELS